MPRTITASLLALFCTGAFAASASAVPSDGGVSYGSGEPTPSVGDGGTLIVRTTVLAGHRLHVRGTLSGSDAGRRVTVQRQIKSGGWRQAATTTTTAGGAFDAVWNTRQAGRFTLRAIPTPPAPSPTQATASSASVAATGVTAVSVFREGVATYFGPGFYGQRTACGQVLRHATIGVAHRTLPCGTLVDLYYKGTTITVPVIDRGPFRAGTTWDLTAAAAKSLGMDQTATIGALRSATSGR